MPPKLKTGIYLPNYGPFGDVNTIADLAVEAENAGWDGFFLWDHKLSRFLPDPFRRQAKYFFGKAVKKGSETLEIESNYL